MNLKKYFQANLSMIAVMICVAIMPAAIVGLTYKAGEVAPIIITPWSAGDALSYAGSISAAIIAIDGVLLSLDYSNRQREQTLRDQDSPYFGLVSLAFSCATLPSDVIYDDPRCFNDYLPRYELLCTKSEDGRVLHREVDEKFVFVLIDGEDIGYRRVLPSDIAKNLGKPIIRENPSSGMSIDASSQSLYFPILFKNIGGPATAVRVGINRKTDSEWSAVKNWTLDKGESFYLGLYVSFSHQKQYDPYEIRVIYSDVHGIQYMQRFELLIGTNEKDHSGSIQLEVAGSKEVLSLDKRISYLASNKESEILVAEELGQKH